MCCDDLAGDVIHTASQNRGCLRIFSIVLALFSAVATVALAFTYTKNYAEASHLAAATCQVTGYTLSTLNQVVSCQCEGDTKTGDDACYSYFPCLHITAKYISTEFGESTPIIGEVTLYEDYYYMRKSARMEKQDCFVSPCNIDYSNNINAVFSAEAEYAYYKKEVDCYYDPKYPTKAVVKRTAQGLAYIVVIIPGSCFIVAVILLVFSFCCVD